MTDCLSIAENKGIKTFNNFKPEKIDFILTSIQKIQIKSIEISYKLL